ncbi:unnamed protein product [Ambrosiozyma monospora]|uniref:Unnamed protein product n=1 Tax=Ambrosiozyma monospora TaxID=43982 RepID=A0ACB5T0G5_AMBMO|nr:unnamed protein product [Ambrosiozyma monospora]
MSHNLNTSHRIVNLVNGKVVDSFRRLAKFIAQENIHVDIEKTLNQYMSINSTACCMFCGKMHSSGTQCFFLHPVSPTLIEERPFCPFHMMSNRYRSVPKYNIVWHYAFNHYQKKYLTVNDLNDNCWVTMIFICSFLFPTNEPLIDCFASVLCLCERKCPSYFAEDEFTTIEESFSELLEEVFIQCHDFKDEIMTLKNFKPRYDPQTELETRTEFWMNNSTLHSEFKPFKFDLMDIDDINIRAATIITNEALIIQTYPITDTGKPIHESVKYFETETDY